MIDFRSDTLTKPNDAMRSAMMQAEVGDDVFSEDPTINALEEKMAQMFAKEAGLFCPSGTMCNQIAVKVHTQPGDEVICSKLSHIYLYEGGGLAMNSGVTSKLLDCDRGVFTSEQIVKNINPDDVHKARTSLISIEDSCNKGGGRVWPLSELNAIKTLAEKENLSVHLDGARVFNALQVNQIKSQVYGKFFDSISICLSKGLGAPVGSVLLGTNGFIKQARRVRKVFGGGMRQAGYLAAAGIYALENNIERLGIDHQRARDCAAKLSTLSEIESIVPVETNIVIFNLRPDISTEEFIKKLYDKGVHVIHMGGQSVRIVYHLDISEEDHHQFMDIIASL